ncbi:hypothetical protein FM120_31560 [Sphingobacterium faecium PCAi_F2.5]|nr:hypothetical protein FM120_31560 [Sphingobacterium faecium PCAi_F2.5]
MLRSAGTMIAKMLSCFVMLDLITGQKYNNVALFENYNATLLC